MSIIVSNCQHCDEQQFQTANYEMRLVGTSSAALWNRLPNNIKIARNVIHFKRLVKLYLASTS